MAEKKTFAVAEDEYTRIAKAGGAGKPLTHVVEQNPPAPIADSSVTVFPDEFPRDRIHPLQGEELDGTVNAVLKAMTFHEKLNLLADCWTAPKPTGCSSYVPGVPRLGVPVMFQHDGPCGVNSIYETTNLPNGLVAGSTFDPELAYEYGRVLGEELRSIGSNWQLGCQFDLSRSPFWMRSKDTFGEDYYLTGEMAAAEVAGLQAQGAGAMGKHIGAYCTNGDQMLVETVDEQTFHTAYLHPFEQAAKRSDLASIMSSYNRVNGYFSASNAYMAKDVLRDMWQWKGNLTTDAGGNKEVSTGLGTDCEMARTLHTEENIRGYLAAGKLTMADIDTAVRHVLWGYGVVGQLGLVEVDAITGLAKEEPGRTEPILFPDTYYQDRAAGLYAEHHKTAVKIAEKGITLLKNENHALPLTEEDLRDGVALIGYGAKHYINGIAIERAYGVQEHIQSPEEALRDCCGGDISLTVAPMRDPHGTTIPASQFYLTADGAEHGLTRSYGILEEDCYVAPPRFPGMPSPFGAAKKQATKMPGRTTGSIAGVDAKLEFSTNAKAFTNGHGGTAFPCGDAYTWKGYLEAPEAGEYRIVMQYIGGEAGVRLFDGEKEIANAGGNIDPMGDHGTQWAFDDPTPEGMMSKSAVVTLEKGKRYRVLAAAKSVFADKNLSLRLAWVTPSAAKAELEQALEAARTNKKVVFFARRIALMPFEDFTKKQLVLENGEDLRMIEEAARAAGNQVVVLAFAPSAITLEGGWEPDADAIVNCFYPGQGTQAALARLLSGKANFSGKLSMTIPKTSADTCISYSPEIIAERQGIYTGMGGEMHIKLSEGLNFGYRWNEDMGVEPGYAFGHGLSYTTFAYTDAGARRTETGLDVTVTVRNTGAMAGDEVVQVYLGPGRGPDYVQFAKKQLAGFLRVRDIQPGEARTVTVSVPERMLCYWDIKRQLTERADGTKDKWVLAAGARTVMVGAASDDIRQSLSINIE